MPRTRTVCAEVKEAMVGGSRAPEIFKQQTSGKEELNVRGFLVLLSEVSVLMVCNKKQCTRPAGLWCCQRQSNLM